MERPKTAVFAWDTFKLWPPGRMRMDAEAFVGSATELFDAMLRGPFPLTWPTAKAAAFMFAHGLELFLKAAILHAGKEVTFTHDLEQLYRTYQNLYPGKKFEFPGNVEGFVVENKKIPFEDFLKYPEDISLIGSTWDASIYIDVSVWNERVASFGREIGRLWSDISARYAVDPARWSKP